MVPTLTFIYNEVVELSREHEVKVICNNHYLDEKFRFSNVVEIPFKYDFFCQKIVWYIEKFDFLMTRKNSKFKKKLQKTIDSFDPDIIHLHFGYESIKFLDNFINHKKKPIFITFHGYDASQMLRSNAYVKKLNFFLSNKNIVPICVSNFIKSNLIKAGLPMDASELLYCGINVDFFKRQTNKPHSDKFVFIQISTFNEKKGHIYTLKAFKIFLDRVHNKNNFKLVLAGGWLLFDQIKDEVIKMDLSNFVEFPGIVDHEQARILLENANVLVHHSVTAGNGDTEGLPNGIIEAMSMELPIISTYHAGIPELVEDGVNGYLVNERDINAYANRMYDITSWNRQPKNREKVLETFSIKSHNDNLVEIYKKHLI